MQISVAIQQSPKNNLALQNKNISSNKIFMISLNKLLNLDNLVFQSSLFDLVGYDSGTGVLSVVYSAPAAGVPEPSTWALLLLGAAGLLYVRKRTHK